MFSVDFDVLSGSSIADGAAFPHVFEMTALSVRVSALPDALDDQTVARQVTGAVDASSLVTP